MNATKPDPVYYAVHRVPIGELILSSDGTSLIGVGLPSHPAESVVRPLWKRDDQLGVFRRVIDQLDAYFEGSLEAFDLPLRFEGTAFQRQAWQCLMEIPYGQTISYAEQARRIGRTGAARAVGAANGRNPIPIIAPCHRVIGTNGGLTGYGGGLEVKEWLIRHEDETLSRR